MADQGTPYLGRHPVLQTRATSVAAEPARFLGVDAQIDPCLPIAALEAAGAKRPSGGAPYRVAGVRLPPCRGRHGARQLWRDASQGGPASIACFAA